MKFCKKCGLDKKLSQFCKDKSRFSGVAPYCKSCMADYHKNYYIKNRVNLLKKEKDKDKVKKRQYMNKRYAENREILSAKNLEWKINNPEKIQSYNQKRRAIKAKSNGFYTASEIKNLLKLQKEKCPVCKSDISKKYHVDHIFPISKGGRNDIGNIQLLCPHCNLSKHTKHPIDFMQSRGFLL